LVEPLERLERAAVDKRLARGIACLLGTLTFSTFREFPKRGSLPLKNPKRLERSEAIELLERLGTGCIWLSAAVELLEPLHKRLPFYGLCGEREPLLLQIPNQRLGVRSR
jgi:hypothetical protein